MRGRRWMARCAKVKEEKKERTKECEEERKNDNFACNKMDGCVEGKGRTMRSF